MQQDEGLLSLSYWDPSQSPPAINETAGHQFVEDSDRVVLGEAVTRGSVAASSGAVDRSPSLSPRAPQRRVGRPLKWPAHSADLDKQHLSEGDRRRLKRRIANRESARRVRQKRQDAMEEAQAHNDELSQQLAALQAHKQRTDAYKADLLQELEQMRSRYEHVKAQNEQLRGIAGTAAPTDTDAGVSLSLQAAGGSLHSTDTTAGMRLLLVDTHSERCQPHTPNISPLQTAIQPSPGSDVISEATPSPGSHPDRVSQMDRSGTGATVTTGHLASTDAPAAAAMRGPFSGVVTTLACGKSAGPPHSMPPLPGSAEQLSQCQQEGGPTAFAMAKPLATAQREQARPAATPINDTLDWLLDQPSIESLRSEDLALLAM